MFIHIIFYFLMIRPQQKRQKEVDELLKSLRKLIDEDSLAIILVEQHAKVALGVTQSALVLNRGRVAHYGPSAELLDDPQRLASLVVA